MRLADPARLRKGRRLAGVAALHRAAFRAAKRAGAPVVRFSHPGAAGHERCRDVCLTYLSREEALAAEPVRRARRRVPARRWRWP